MDTATQYIGSEGAGAATKGSLPLLIQLPLVRISKFLLSTPRDDLRGTPSYARQRCFELNFIQLENFL